MKKHDGRTRKRRVAFQDEPPYKREQPKRVKTEEISEPASCHGDRKESKDQCHKQDATACSSKQSDRPSRAPQSSLVKMIVTDLLPLSIVKGRGFRGFMRTLNPGLSIPRGIDSLRSDLCQLYEQVKAEVKASLDSVRDIVLTSESWSRETESYMTVSCHFVDDKWRLKSYVLETADFPGPHTPEDVVNQLERISNEWNVRGKVHVIVTNKSQIVHAVESAKWKHIPCFAYTLDRMAADALRGIPAFESLLKKCKDILRYLHHESKGTGRFKESQLELPPHQSTLSAETRWNSTLDILEAFTHQHSTINSVLSHSGMHTLCLNDCEVAEINDVVAAFRVFQDATKDMSREKYVPVSNIIPLARVLKEKMRELGQNRNKVAERLASQCAQRFVDIEQNYKLAVSTTLDARFKNILPNNMFKDRLIKDMAVLSSSLQSNSTASPEDQLWEDFDRRSELEEELRRYTVKKTVPRSANPLDWWQQQSKEFPNLHRAARRYLGTVSTSAPAERTFSKAGEDFSLQRSRLELENVNMMLFLYSNRQTS